MRDPIFELTVTVPDQKRAITAATIAAMFAEDYPTRTAGARHGVVYRNDGRYYNVYWTMARRAVRVVDITEDTINA